MTDPNQTQTDGQIILTATAATLAAVIVAKAADTQLDLLRKFAALIAKYGVGDLLLFSLRRVATASAKQFQADTRTLAATVIGKAVHEGAAAAGGGVDNDTPMRFGLAGDSWESHAERSARAIREDLAGKLNQLGFTPQVNTDPAQIFQHFIDSFSLDLVTGSMTLATRSQAVETS